MGFADLTDVLGVTPPKVLPVRGRNVNFPGVISARAGMLLLTIQRAAASGEPAELVTARLSNSDAMFLEYELLGDGAEILDNLGVMGDARQHIMTTLAVWHLSGEDAAEAAWSGKPQPPRGDSKRKGGRRSKTSRAGGAKGNFRTANGA